MATTRAALLWNTRTQQGVYFYDRPLGNKVSRVIKSAAFYKLCIKVNWGRMQARVWERRRKNFCCRHHFNKPLVMCGPAQQIKRPSVPVRRRRRICARRTNKIPFLLFIPAASPLRVAALLMLRWINVFFTRAIRGFEISPRSSMKMFWLYVKTK